MTEFLLHIGTHKTGTTSFQHFLGKNADALFERNVHVLADRGSNQSGPGRFNIKVIAHHFLRPELATGPRLRSAVPQLSEADSLQFENSLIDEINGSSCSKVVGSAEAFCYMRSNREHEHLSRFLRQLTRRPRFFIVFREDASWRRSRSDQIERSPIRSQIADPCIPENNSVTAEWYFDKAAIRRFWSGLGDLVELDYDAYPDICEALASTMGIDCEGLSFVPRLNVSGAV